MEQRAFLLIEDSDVIVKTLESILRRKFSGYNIFRAKGREDGLRRYHQHEDQVALTLLDLALSDGSRHRSYKSNYKNRPRRQNHCHIGQPAGRPQPTRT